MIARKWLFFLFLIASVLFNAIAVAQGVRKPHYSRDGETYFDDRDDHFLNPVGLIAPGAFLIYGGLKPVVSGIATLDNRIMENVTTHHPNFHTTAENYVMWVPSASVYILDAAHVQTEHTFLRHLAIDAGSVLITGGIGFAMRKISQKIPAYENTTTQFPSGHTANAFRGAEILHQELKYSHPVWSYSGYVVATGVGLLRIYNKQHYLSEVVAGAGLGILSTKLTYWLFQKINFID